VRILLDECIDHRLARDLAGHEVSTVARTRWRGKENGELLGLAAAQFDVFLTTDRNLSFQRNVERFDLAVIVLNAPSNRLSDLRRLVPELLEALPFVQPGQTRQIGV
jgi:predicted nuclease of predicted toxin-antitoxin system